MINVITKARAGTFLALIAIAALYTEAAAAYTVYQLEKDYYAIVCQDGQIFSYSGGAGGIGIVGQALCEGHGGIVGGNGGGVTTTKAPAEVARVVQSCKGAGARQVDAKTAECKTRIRVNRWEANRSEPEAAAPATSHNASRSNRSQGIQ